jgi:hypothetical protein
MKSIGLIASLILLSTFCVGQNHPPVAVNDTVWGIDGYPVLVYPLRNDYDPDGDSIQIVKLYGEKINDTTLRISPHFYPIPSEVNYTTSRQTSYRIKDFYNNYALGRIIFLNKIPVKYDYLDINNINALISPFGNHFWDLDSSRFEVPKGSGKHAIFNNSIWVGGINESNSLCIAAERYRQEGTDYFIGPISDSYDSSYMRKWYRVWKLDKQQVRYHMNNYASLGYEPIEAIANWPAQGDVAKGQIAGIAPFFDLNKNGIYDPANGDYPIIRGDQAVFFILNDSASIHTETKSHKIGIEMHGMAYAFDKPDDSTLNNTIFFHYDIINRSSRTYDSTYIGVNSDFDLGCFSDDFMGTDVSNGLFYAYNGNPFDGNGEPWSYGEHPPAIGIKVIGGPYLEPDGQDNPSGDCQYSINGLGFGDEISDNERMGLTHTTSLQHVYWGCPTYGESYFLPYDDMKFPYKYGTTGIINLCDSTTSGVGPDCNFIFPGNSDTLCNWGTMGIAPNGGYNQNGKYWTEQSIGNIPDDQRGVASVGPFTFQAWATVPLDYCFTWARDYQGDNNSSVDLLRERVAGLNSSWNELISLPVSYYGTSDSTKPVKLTLYPNPVHNQLTIMFESIKILPYYLFSINGVMMSTGKLFPGKNYLDFTALAQGLYLVRCEGKYYKIIKI